MKRAFTLLACLLFMAVGKVSAVDLKVPSQYSTIKSAIKKAQVGDRVLVAPGTYQENLEIRKNITVQSEQGADQTIIDGGAKDSVFLLADTHFDGVNNLTIKGFTIRNGKSVEGKGGGISIYNSDALIEDSFIINNRSEMDGGGVLVNQKSNAVLRNNFISNNSAPRFGGGIMIVGQSNPTIFNNNIMDNKAKGLHFSSGGPSGGAIFVDGNSAPQIVKNQVSNNYAEFAGGGVSLRVGVRAIIDSNGFTGNRSNYGGGIHIETEGGVSTLINNDFVGNVAELQPGQSVSYGGAISVYNQSKPIIKNNQIRYNRAYSGGGGIVVAENADVTISENTLRENSATGNPNGAEGGGIYLANATGRIFNNVIVKNVANKTGAGISLLDNAKVKVYNNTIVNNDKSSNALMDDASGVGIFIRETISSATVANNIITQNSSYQIFEERGRAKIENNLINNDGKGVYFSWDTNGVSTTQDLNSMVNQATNNFSGNENFVSDDYAIGSSSEAINRGTKPLSQYDKKYRIRESQSDVGAYEYLSAQQKKQLSQIYRFWSDSYKHHFYTIDQDERDYILTTQPNSIWRYEGVGFNAFKGHDCQSENKVHRFWSDTYQGHFYTISEKEKKEVERDYPDHIWRYEGVAYCADRGVKPGNAPLYRFWSDTYNGHFYTVSQGEKELVERDYPENVWRYEGVGYWAYPN